MITKINRYLLLFTVYSAVFFGYSFQVIGIKGILPIGEMVAVYFILSCGIKKLRSFAKEPFFAPFLIFILYGLIRAVFSFNIHGLWALRDAVPVLDAVFLYIGYYYASYERNRDFLLRSLPVLLLLIVVFGSPIKYLLMPYSPYVTSAHGLPVSVFKTMAHARWVLWSSVYFLLFAKESAWKYPIVALLVSYAIIANQKRTIMLQTIIVYFYIFIADIRRYSKRVVVFACIIFVLLLCLQGISVENLGLESTRITSISFSNIWDSFFLSAIGKGSQHGAVAGYYQRLAWWQNIWQRLTISIDSFLFGLGYGTDLNVGQGFINIAGVSAREPHNSYISMVARIGFFGFVLYLNFIISLIRSWLVNLKTAVKNNQIYLKKLLIFFGAMFLFCFILAIGEDAFEKTYITIPFYFFWGFILKYAGIILKKER